MRSYLLLFFLTLSSLYGNYSRENKLDHVVLQLHWRYTYDFAGFIMAKEKGFYKDAGLDVKLREYRYGMDIEKEVLEGRANYGIYNSKILLDYLRGKPLKLLASFFKRSALVIVAQPEIKTLLDLKGKTVMGGTKKDFIINFQPYFEKYGLHVNDIKIVPHSYRIDEFVQKKVDAMTAFFSNEIIKLREAGVPFTVFDPSEDNLFVMQLELFTTQNEYKHHKERTEDFIKASIKGWEYVFAHQQESIETIYKKYNPNHLSKEDIAKEAKAVEKMILPYTYEIGSIDKSFLKKQSKLFEKYYDIEVHKPLEDYIYDPYKPDTLKLTYKETQYIKKHKNVPLCVYKDWLPIDDLIKGKQSGIMGDIYAKIAQKTGLRFTYVGVGDIQEFYDALKNRKCKIISVTTPSLAKAYNLFSTDVFMQSSFTVLTALDKSFVKNPYTLRKKKLLVRSHFAKSYLERIYPYLQITFENDPKKMAQEVINGESYGIITFDEKADYFIDKYGNGKLKVGGFLAKHRPVQAVVGTVKSEPVLASIINKALQSISKKELDNIVNSWRLTRYHKETDYTLLFEILGVFLVIIAIMWYYQRKIKWLNQELEKTVEKKTKELRELNEQLEALVKQKVEEIVQKDRILAVQSKQAVMGEMITMIAHQWRQPLNTLTLQISNLQLRRMMGEVVDLDEYDKTLEQISKTINYLSETIDDFQTFFHPDRELNFVDLKEVVQKAVNFVLPRIKSDDVEILIDIEDKEAMTNVYVNELIQILLNLLNNAIDALEECDKEEKKINISARQEEDTIQIFVKDTACGIDEEIVERLFEPYFSTKGKNGTGLGLYMSQMIIQKQFGGEIRVESSKEGSTFIVEFTKF